MADLPLKFPSLSGASPKKILIVGPSWVGDMVMSHVAVQLLRASYPQSHIAVTAPTASLPIASRMAEVNQTIVWPFGHGAVQWKARLAFARELSSQRFDLAVVLTNTWKSALIPWLAGIPQRRGWLGEFRWGLLNDVRKLIPERWPFMIQRYAELGLEKSQSGKFSTSTEIALPKNAQDAFNYLKNINLPLPKIISDFANQQKLKQQWMPESEECKPLLVLCPGAEFGPAKQWPAKHCAELVTYYLTQGWWVACVGSPKDQKIVSEIENYLIVQKLNLKNWINLSGKTTLLEAVDFIGLANAVVANDSGLMHTAAALQRPLIAIYGSTTSAFTPPLFEKSQAISVELPCRPCFQRECPLGHLNCLNLISPAYVIKNIESI